MSHFLLVYDRSTGTLVELKEMDTEAARDARAALEVKHRGHPDIEIVVLNADSAAALRHTHARYFKTPRELTATN